jgi:hypothetical protein
MHDLPAIVFEEIGANPLVTKCPDAGKVFRTESTKPFRVNSPVLVDVEVRRPLGLSADTWAPTIRK